MNVLASENGQLKHGLEQLLEQNQALDAKVKRLMEDLSIAEHKLDEQIKLLSVQKSEFNKQKECFSHVLQHMQQGLWVRSILPAQRQETGNECTMKEVSVTLERHNITFREAFCCLCPFDKVVKMEIEKRFGIDENHQLVSIVSGANNFDREEVVSGTSLTLFHLLPASEDHHLQLQVKVRITPVLDIQEADLILSCPLGSGSYGTVFKGKHVPTSRDVAVKTLHDAITETYSVDHFRLEAEIVSGLRHPNIVKCIGTCTGADGKLMIVSELMCCSLKQLLQQKHLKFVEVAAIALGIAKGMDALHRQNYMHRDLSGNNILLDSKGTPKICDFGVSRVMNSRTMQASIMQSKVPGTPGYMSPQMFTGNYTLKGDVWSFGILTTEMIHGAFVDCTLHTTLAQQIAFLNEQKRLFSPPEVEEVDNLSREATESTVVCCLSRRKESLRTVETLLRSPDSPLFVMSGPNNSATTVGIGDLGTAAELLLLVVQSCLSICERNRVPFTVIAQ
ncbi:TKL family protein kinase [Pelomyxa schiedti]|nr:TKL family protein kinase [Pelomyxa schiedti]